MFVCLCITRIECVFFVCFFFKGKLHVNIEELTKHISVKLSNMIGIKFLHTDGEKNQTQVKLI